MGEEILVCRHRQCHHSDRLQAHLGFNLHDHLVNEALWHEALEKKPSLLCGGGHVTLILSPQQIGQRKIPAWGMLIRGRQFTYNQKNQFDCQLSQACWTRKRKVP